MGSGSMADNRLLASLESGMFNIFLEFTPRNPRELVQIADIARMAVSLNDEYRARGAVFSAVMLTQNPGGRLSYELVQAVSILRQQGFPETLSLVPHVTCKDLNLDALEVQLNALVDLGIDTVLALTGDKPATAQGVFQVDSLGLLMLVNRLNAQIARKAKDIDSLKKSPQIVSGAAISPFKYSEPSLMMQFIKVEKKVSCGASFLITQAGWDVAKNEELIRRKDALGIPLIGNALLLDYKGAYVMKDLPGCVVPKPFLDKLQAESEDDAINRAAQQLAMLKGLGYHGVDIGNVMTFEQVREIVERGLAIKDWRAFEHNISFQPESGKPARLTRKPILMNMLHKLTFEEKGSLFSLCKKVCSPMERSFQKGRGPLYRVFFGIEQLVKGTLFECRNCGDCYLPENHFVCTIGGCAKGLPNPPCGDSTVDGLCGNEPTRPCAGELIYHRAVREKGVEEIKRHVFGSRNVSLDGTSSFLNHWYGRDHDIRVTLEKVSGLKQIAELLHASIPSVGPAMQYIRELGDKAFVSYNRGVNVIIDLIIQQAERNPAFIDINIDQLGGDTPSLIRKFVRLVKQYGTGVPVCIDSSNPEVLKSGLEEWYASGEPVETPLVNSVNYAEIEKSRPLLELRKRFKFGIVGLLMGAQGVLKSSDEMVDAARTIFKVASGYGFKPEEVFFDTVTLGITFDSPITELGEFKPSHTHNSFHAIQKIRNDPEMKDVNAVLGVSNWTHDVKKRRIGHNRAFIAVAQKYGLNAVIIDVLQDYGIKPAPPELMELVDMFVSLDGSEDSVFTYNAKIREMRQKGWV